MGSWESHNMANKIELIYRSIKSTLHMKLKFWKKKFCFDVLNFDAWIIPPTRKTKVSDYGCKMVKPEIGSK